MSSRNSVKARAAALGVELRRESSTRTVWPAEFVPLGDRLAEHLRDGATLAGFDVSVTAPTDGSDGAAPMALGEGSKGSRRSAGLSLTAATDSSDLAQLVAAMAPPPSPADPLAVPRGLAEAAYLGAWLTTPSWPDCLGWPLARFAAGAPVTAPALASSWSAGRMARQCGGGSALSNGSHSALALESVGAMAS